MGKQKKDFLPYFNLGGNLYDNVKKKKDLK